MACSLEGTIARMFPGRAPSTLMAQAINFRSSTGGEWRKLGDASRERAWDVIPQNVRELLQLEF